MNMHDYQAPPGLLKDRVILITGASGAIGAAAARAYAAAGASVILVGRTQGKLEKVYDEIVAAGHPTPAIAPLNLETAPPEDYQRLAGMIRQEFGRLDGLLHAAAWLGVLAPLEHYDIGVWSRVMQVNLNAPMLMTRACLGLLKESPDASVLFSSCEVGRQGTAYWGAFGAGFAAVENLAQQLSEELEANTAVRVNCVDPGPIRSRLRALAFPGEDPNQLPPAETVIPAYLYLMGPDSREVNGQRIGAGKG